MYTQSWYPSILPCVGATGTTAVSFTSTVGHAVVSIDLNSATDFTAMWPIMSSAFEVTKIGLYVTTAVVSVAAPVCTFYRSNSIAVPAKTETIGTVTLAAAQAASVTVVNILHMATTKTGVLLQPGEAVTLDMTTVAGTSGRAIPFIEGHWSQFAPANYAGAGTYAKTTTSATGAYIVVAA